jgi:hypothetical protein
MDNPWLIGALVLNLAALADVWASRLSSTAKVLWSLTLVFVVGVGLAAWLLTRHTAHQPLAEIEPTFSDPERLT